MKNVITLDKFLTMHFLTSHDEYRIWLAEWKTMEVVKRRRAMMLDRVTLEQHQVEEGPTYAAGRFN